MMITSLILKDYFQRCLGVHLLLFPLTPKKGFHSPPLISLALDSSNEHKVPEEAWSPEKPWFAHLFSFCPSYFKSFLNYPRILHLSDPGSLISASSALMSAFSSSGTFFSLSTLPLCLLSLSLTLPFSLPFLIFSPWNISLLMRPERK